jgi:HEAT repeat protein
MTEFGMLILAALLLQSASLDSVSPKERIDAVERMSALGKTENVAPLAEALKKEPRSDVRAEIVAGLARIGGKEPVPVITAVLGADLDKDVRLQAVDSLQRLYIPVETPGTLGTVFNKVKSVFEEPGRPVVQSSSRVDPAVNAALADAMQKDSNQEVRAAAARALGSLMAKDRVAVMISTLENPQNQEHPEVRLEIAESLGLIRDVAAGPALQRAIKDSDRRIVQAAITSIGLVGFKDARPALENIFRTDRSTQSRKLAIEAIALMRDPAALAFFESLLGSSDDYYREMAAEGMGRIATDPSVLKTRYETEKKANVKYALAFALVAADQDTYFNDLANGLLTRQDYQVEAYIQELGLYEGKLPKIHEYLKSPNGRIRARMVRIAGNIADPSSRPLIQELTMDKDPEVVREALAALRKLTVI